MKDVAIAHVIGNMQCREEQRIVGQEDHRSDRISDFFRYQRGDQRGGKRRQHTKVEEDQQRIDGDRAPVADGSPEARRERARRATILEYDKSRREPQRKQERERAKRAEQHRHLDVDARDEGLVDLGNP